MQRRTLQNRKKNWPLKRSKTYFGAEYAASAAILNCLQYCLQTSLTKGVKKMTFLMTDPFPEHHFEHCLPA